MTTCRLDSMWTRTLSTTISTSDTSGMAGIIPRTSGRPGLGSTPVAQGEQEAGGDDAGHEPSDVGEERHTALRPGEAQRCEPVDELQQEPEAQDHDRRHI